MTTDEIHGIKALLLIVLGVIIEYYTRKPTFKKRDRY